MKVATQSSTASRCRIRAIAHARSRVEDHDFGVDTVEELHSRLECGNSHPSDVEAMLSDVRAILNGDRGNDALAGFSETLLKIATRNSKAV